MQTYKLLSNDSVLLSQPVLIKQFGRAGAHFLSQLHYWLTKHDLPTCNHQGQKWIYNTAEEWAEQLQLSARHVRRLISEFVELGIIRVAKLHKIKSVRTNYYSIDYDRLNSAIDITTYNSSPDKMSSPLGQNVSMYIQKKPNKDFNKSEQDHNLDEVKEEALPYKQVKQVSNVNLKNEKKNQKDLLQPLQQPKTDNLAAKTSTAQDMLKIWNEHFQDKSTEKLSKHLAPLLVAAFRHKFTNDLSSWRAYCEQIKSSTYLMGESFKLNLAWALKFSTIERIRAGELGVKKVKETTLSAVVHSEQQIDQMIENSQESTTAKAIRYKIIQAIGHNAYYSWFHQAKFCEEGGVVNMIAPNSFVEQYWEINFDWILKMNNYHF